MEENHSQSTRKPLTRPSMTKPPTTIAAAIAMRLQRMALPFPDAELTLLSPSAVERSEFSRTAAAPVPKDSGLAGRTTYMTIRSYSQGEPAAGSHPAE